MHTNTKVDSRYNGIIVFTIIYRENGECKNVTTTMTQMPFQHTESISYNNLEFLSCNFSSLSNDFYIDGFIFHFFFVIFSTRIISHCQNGVIIVDSDLDV
jgi:hypothetical protein